MRLCYRISGATNVEWSSKNSATQINYSTISSAFEIKTFGKIQGQVRSICSQLLLDDVLYISKE